MSSRVFARRVAVAAVYIAGLVTLTCVGIWDIWFIIDDYTRDNRVTAVQSVNVTGRFPFLLSNVKVCFDYSAAGETIYPQKLWEDKFYPLLRTLWTGQETHYDSSENATTWERGLQAALPHIYMYYLIGDIEKYGPDMAPSYSPTRPFGNQEFADSINMNKTELYRIVDSYITSPDKLLLMKQSIDILQFYLGGVAPGIGLTIMSEGPNTKATYTANIAYMGAPIAEEGCFRLPIPDTVTPEVNGIIYGHVLTTNGMKPYIPPVGLRFPEDYKIGKDVDYLVSVVISNTAVTNSTLFPPCTPDYETEPECLEDSAVQAIADICQCVPLTRIAKGAIDLSYPTRNKLCTTATYEKCWKKAMDEVTRRQDEIKKEKTCAPCINRKNSYVITTKELTSKIYAEPTEVLKSFMNFTQEEIRDYKLWPSPRILVSIVSLDHSYIVLQIKPQYTLPQLISQIGGDLGLYIGFSMISILEAVLFVYHMYNHRRQSTNEQRTDEPSKRGFLDGFRYITRFLFRNFDTAAQYNDIELLARNKTDTASAAEYVQSQLQSIRQEIQALGRELQKNIQEAGSHQSQINMELKKELQKMKIRIAVIREGNKEARRTQIG